MRSAKLQFGTIEYNDMNRDFIKKFNLSPDSIMQLAIQLAFYRTFKVKFFLINLLFCLIN